MSRLSLIKKQKDLRKKRVSRLINGTSDRPRLSVSISNKHITAQLIDDTKSQTLVYVTTVGAKHLDKNLTDQAILVGAEIAKKAKSAKITKVIFDRGAKNYHGRVKALADAAREGGLEF